MNIEIHLKSVGGKWGLGERELVSANRSTIQTSLSSSSCWSWEMRNRNAIKKSPPFLPPFSSSFSSFPCPTQSSHFAIIIIIHIIIKYTFTPLSASVSGIIFAVVVVVVFLISIIKKIFFPCFLFLSFYLFPFFCLTIF